jgi:hypothetical protein
MSLMEKFSFVVIAACILCLAAAGSKVCAGDMNPCSKEIAKFCKNIKPGSNEIIGCLEAHEADLSPECRAYEMKMEGPKGEKKEIAKIKMRFRQDCKADLVKFCKDVDPADSGLVKCIYRFEKEVSASCKGWIKADKDESAKPKK